MTRCAHISIVIADDHVMFVEAMRLLLAQTPEIRLVGVARDGDALLSLIAEQVPDVALVDLSMPGPGAAAIARQVADQQLECRLIALIMHEEPHLAGSLIHGGFSGYVVKGSDVGDLRRAIRQVVARQTFLSAAVAEQTTGGTDPQTVLTPRELECLRAASLGMPNKTIALHLGVSLRTVKFHFENAFRKLNARNRSGAIAIGRQDGLL
ncbi:LuxR C-terminal-related transcriptional regulator [Dinoroseobacter sp. S375]|uniref:response regulator transcription factor n=1 Tax=Dinoroseobacter sp. S375 TaxID=3415136 RepID=UPI003C7E7CAB